MIQHSMSAERVHRKDTLESYEQSIELAIQTMREHFSEPLMLDDLADAAFMSRCHFARVFSVLTGVSPARFLGAIRMHEAKRLLLQSQRNVTDISLDVGYNSLGTFTRTFTDTVGYTPSRFRKTAQFLSALSWEDIRRQMKNVLNNVSSPTIEGKWISQTEYAIVVVGLFDAALPKCHPVSCDVSESCQFSLHRCDHSRFHILGVGLKPTATVADAILMKNTKVEIGAIRLEQNDMLRDLTLCLRPSTEIDPPIVFGFPLFVAEALTRPEVSKLGEASSVAHELI